MAVQADRRSAWLRGWQESRHPDVRGSGCRCSPHRRRGRGGPGRPGDCTERPRPAPPPSPWREVAAVLTFRDQQQDTHGSARAADAALLIWCQRSQIEVRSAAPLRRPPSTIPHHRTQEALADAQRSACVAPSPQDSWWRRCKNTVCSVKQGLRWRRDNQAPAPCRQLWRLRFRPPSHCCCSGQEEPWPGLGPVSSSPGRRWSPSREHCEQGPARTLLPQGSAEAPQGGDSPHTGVGALSPPGLPR